MKLFPILLDSKEKREHPDWPTSVPWSLIEPHEEQARANHYQTLKRLAERGGLSPLEMQYIIQDRKFVYHNDYTAATAEAVAFISDLLTKRYVHRNEGDLVKVIEQATRPVA